MIGLGNVALLGDRPFASGGTTTTYSSSGQSFSVHSVTAAGNVNISTRGTVPHYDLFVVGGGGGGGTQYSQATGGGGAGGVLDLSEPLSPGTHSVSRGNGGRGGCHGSPTALNGDNSVFGPYVAHGGGRGFGVGGVGDGGSGGGGGPAAGAGTTGQGTSGGIRNPSNTRFTSGGGGGKTQAGLNGGAGKGGDGITNNRRTGANVGYGGGGGGGGTPQGSLSLAGFGGGGRGGCNPVCFENPGCRNATVGSANTGGGGGGAGSTCFGGDAPVCSAAGGTGIVFLRWRTA